MDKVTLNRHHRNEADGEPPLLKPEKFYHISTYNYVRELPAAELLHTIYTSIILK